MDAVDIVWALALCARECDACGCSEPWVIGNDWGGGRGHVTSSAEGDRGENGDRVAFTSHWAHGVGAVGLSVDLRCGCDDQAFVRQTARSSSGIQSAQAWASFACLPQLSSLWTETDARGGRVGGKPQPCQSHATGAVADTRWFGIAQAAQAGAWRCGIGRRADVLRSGGARAELSVYAQADSQRQALH